MRARNPRRSPKKDLSRIDRAAKREDQKAQGAFDGRFREKVVPDKKRYTRKRKPPADNA